MSRKNYKPESLMMSHGYKPELSEGSIKTPIFLTSTFVFESAEAGKSFFELAYGLREPEAGEESGLIYSRLNNPNLEILEDRLCLWDNAEECAVFESGMSAISTCFLEFLRPGDLLLHSSPTYGGTDHFIEHYLKDIGIDSITFYASDSEQDIIDKIESSGKADKLSMIYIETPANPNNDLIDIALCRKIADRYSEDKKVTVAVDNTYMGPIWCNPINHGADLVIYSATKFIGGHSDIIAGAVLGKAEEMKRVLTLRTFFGNMASPHTCWMLTRSLETLKIRMERQAANAEQIAHWLQDHPKVEKVYYLGLLEPGKADYELYKKQYSSPGAMISFDIKGGEAEAFRFLNSVQLFKLAVSLGSTESLAQHPATMTHIDMDPELKKRVNVTEKLIRMSIGIEDPDDLISDIAQALEQV